MPRRPAVIRDLVVSAAISVVAASGSTLAQTLPPGNSTQTERFVPLPNGRTAGVNAGVWASAISNGGPLPSHERMLVVSPAGAVLGVVDGDREHVILPIGLVLELSHTPLRATLVHNHPDSVSLSGADLFQLAKAGVERVVAVGHDGSVYEAAAAAEYRAGDAVEYHYAIVLTRVLERLDRETRLTGGNLQSLYPHAAHIMALIFDRVGVIRYSARPSLDVWNTFQRYRPVIQRVVDAEASRFRADLGISVE